MVSCSDSKKTSFGIILVAIFCILTSLISHAANNVQRLTINNTTYTLPTGGNKCHQVASRDLLYCESTDKWGSSVYYYVQSYETNLNDYELVKGSSNSDSNGRHYIPSKRPTKVDVGGVKYSLPKDAFDCHQVGRRQMIYCERAKGVDVNSYYYIIGPKESADIIIGTNLENFVCQEEQTNQTIAPGLLCRPSGNVYIKGDGKSAKVAKFVLKDKYDFSSALGSCTACAPDFNHNYRCACCKDRDGNCTKPTSIVLKGGCPSCVGGPCSVKNNNGNLAISQPSISCQLPSALRSNDCNTCKNIVRQAADASTQDAAYHISTQTTACCSCQCG